MIRFWIGFIAAAALAAGLWWFSSHQEAKEELKADSSLIQQQIEQVGKLIVTEGYYSQVFTYKNSQKLFLNLISADKKALVLVNTKATVEYDLRKLKTELNPDNKTVRILEIPDPVLQIYPDFDYYDVTQDYLNPFEGKDYNTIKTKITEQVRAKIEASSIKDQAQDRLMAELANLYFLTKTLGWTLEYEEQIISSEEQLKVLGK